jgi:hypothetical protein
MRLNKFQKAWIDRLMSGKTRKCKMELADGRGRNCCLGVAVNVCKLERIATTDHTDENLARFEETLSALKIEKDGTFDTNKVSDEWIEKIAKYYSQCEEHLFEATDSLISLNDNTNMTHKEIGQFINENREAVFNQ